MDDQKTRPIAVSDVGVRRQERPQRCRWPPRFPVAQRWRAVAANQVDGDQTMHPWFAAQGYACEFIWVAGEDDVSWRRENNDRITLISDKAEYSPGETAEILIPSPFAGEHEALITIERGRIHQHEVIKMNGSSQVYRLPITAEHAPNIYLSVALVQGREGPQEGAAPRLAEFKLGILPIDVEPVAQRLTISLTPSVEQAQPGADVTYQLAVTDVSGQPVEAEFSLDLGDKAVLTLQPRQPEAIVDAYYHRRDLGISTASGLSVSVNRLLRELAEDLGLEQAQFAADAVESEKDMVGAPMPTMLPEAAPMEEAAVAAEAPAPAPESAESPPENAVPSPEQATPAPRAA